MDAKSILEQFIVECQARGGLTSIVASEYLGRTENGHRSTELAEEPTRLEANKSLRQVGLDDRKDLIHDTLKSPNVLEQPSLSFP